MKSARGVGLQLSLGSSITALAEKALRLELPFFQCFFRNHETSTPFVLERVDRDHFVRLRHEHFGSLYVHGSYPINLANETCDHPCLERELYLAEQLHFTHLIVHPGSYARGTTKEDGLANVARVLNKLFLRPLPVTVVLENVAHGNRAIGGDLQDFKEIVERLDKPELIKFCIDTAHAHSFGYDLTSASARDLFCDEIQQTLGFERLALLHLNDTVHKKGARVDHHCILGEGNLGVSTLKALCEEMRLSGAPIILEMPTTPEEKERATVKQVVAWSKGS
jgi:deoxyribonuclease IV